MPVSYTFQVFLDGVRATALYDPESSTSFLSASFSSLHRYRRSRNSKIQLGISVDTSVVPIFCFLDCLVVSDLSCDIILGRDWFTYVSHIFPNATITLSETEHLDFGISPRVGVRTIEQGVSFLLMTFDRRYSSIWSVARNDSMDYDQSPNLIDVGVIGPGATLSDIDPGVTLSSSSLMSSEIPSVSSLSHNETCSVASIPMSISEFLTFIETSSRPVLLSIAQSHNIAVPPRSVLDVIRTLISDHISSGACLGSSLPACTILNSSLRSQDCDDNNTDFQLNIDLKIYILSRLLHKLKLRPLRRILSQNNVDHDSNGSRSYLRRELRKYITRLTHGKRTEEQRNKVLKLEKEHEDQKQRLLETWPQVVSQNLKNKIVKMFQQQTSTETLSTFTCSSCGEATLCSLQQKMLASEVNLDLLKIPLTATLASVLPYHNGRYIYFLFICIYTHSSKSKVLCP